MRFTGDLGKSFQTRDQNGHLVDPASTMRHMGEARKLVGELLDRINGPGLNGYGNMVQRKRLSDGTWISAYVRMIPGTLPIIRTRIENAIGGYGMKQSTSYIFFAATWRPEGFVLTPRSADAPKGWGAPRRDSVTGEKINAPYGTVLDGEHEHFAEALNVVIINRFENNKYLDHPAHIVGLEDALKDLGLTELPENPRLRALVEGKISKANYGFYVPWMTFYEPVNDDFVASFAFWDEAKTWNAETNNTLEYCTLPGLNEGVTPYKPIALDEAHKPKWRQFAEDGSDLIYEEEKTSWFAHWPEELLYDTDAQETTFQLTNYARTSLGLHELIRPIRGFGSNSRATICEIARAKNLDHDLLDGFRPGLEVTKARLYATGSVFAFGENLVAIGLPNPTTTYLAERVVDSWVNSPTHYAVMTDDKWEEGPENTALDVFYAPSVTLDASQYAGPEDEFPMTVSVGCESMQRFDSYNPWIVSYFLAIPVKGHPLSLRAAQAPIFVHPTLASSYFAYRGHRYRVKTATWPDTNTTPYCVLGGTVVVDAGGHEWFRVVVARPALTESEYAADAPLLLVCTMPVACTLSSHGGTSSTITLDPYLWTIESTLTARQLSPSRTIQYGNPASVCTFNLDGSEGVMTWAVNYGGQYVPANSLGGTTFNYDAPVEALLTVQIQDGIAAFDAQVLGDELPVAGGYSLYPSYLGDAQAAITCTYDYLFEVHLYETITLPDTTVHQTSLCTTSSCVLLDFLYLDPLTSDRVVCRRTYTNPTGFTIEILVNDVVVATYENASLAFQGVPAPHAVRMIIQNLNNNYAYLTVYRPYSIECQFVRYKDEYICEVVFYGHQYMEPIDADGDHYIVTSPGIDLAALTGISGLTSILPLGVV